MLHYLGNLLYTLYILFLAASVKRQPGIIIPCCLFLKGRNEGHELRTYTSMLRDGVLQGQEQGIITAKDGQGEGIFGRSRNKEFLPARKVSFRDHYSYERLQV